MYANPQDRLGVLPLIVVEAAKTAVAAVLSKATSAIIGIFDPGQKRDANRLARAQMWFEFAQHGSITAARTLHGGSQVQYTAKERQYYIDRWGTFSQSNPTLAAQALAAGDLGVPEPGSDQAPPALSDQMRQQVEAEIAAYQSGNATPPPVPGSGTTMPPLNIAGFGGPVALILGVGLLLAMTRRRG